MALQTTTVEALLAAGFEKIKDVSPRVALWSGRDAKSNGIMILHDAASGLSREAPESLDPVSTATAIGGLGLILLALVSHPALPFSNAERAAFATEVRSSLG